MRVRSKETVRSELDALITDVQDGLYRLAAWRVKNPEDARDIVQDVFVKFYFSRLEGAADIDNPRAYLFRAVGNACTDFLRKKQLEPRELKENMCTAEPQEDNELSPRYMKIEKLLSEIPSAQAEVIKMRTMAGLSFIEIAGILQLPVTTVSSRFKYGVEKIRTALEIKTI